MQLGAGQGSTVVLAIFIVVFVFRCRSDIRERIIRTASFFANKRLDVADSKHDSAPAIADPHQKNRPTNAENIPSAEKQGNGVDHKESSKSNRSKERRRRGKDPYKEHMKAAKKTSNVLNTKSPNPAPTSASSQPSHLPISEQENQSADSSANHSPLPLIRESILEQHLDDISQYQQDETQRQRRNPSVDSSTHSASQGAGNSFSSSTNSEWHVVGHRSSKSTTNSTSQETIYSGTPSAHTVSEADSQSVQEEIELPTSDSAPSELPQDDLAAAGPSLTELHSADSSSIEEPPPPARATSSSTTITLTATSPTKKPTLKSKPSTSRLADDPWEWDGQSHALAPTASPLSPATSQPKLQKKRSALAVPPVAPVSKPGPSLSASALGSGPSTSTSTSEDSELHPSPSFPTLDHTSAQASPQPLPHVGRKRPSTPLNDGSHAANTNSPRRPHTPRRAPTPGTPPPSLSMQTQLASMKGALEAARLREEKMRTEIQSLTERLEATERNARSLEQQVHHYRQNSYTMFAAQQHALRSNPNHYPNHTSAPSSSVSSPSTSQPQPLHLHMHPSPMPPLMSPGGMMSPININNHHPPSYLYPQQGPPYHAPYMLPMHYPGVGSVAGHGHGPVHGSGSEGSAGTGSGSGSPDVNGGSSSPVDRGRRRTREWEAGASSVTGGGAGEDAYDVGDSGSELNEILMESIFKRPGSIRIKSKTSQRRLAEHWEDGGEEKEENVDEPTEFTFPSISDLGNVRAGKRPLRGNEESALSAGGPLSGTALTQEQEVDTDKNGIGISTIAEADTVTPTLDETASTNNIAVELEAFADVRE